MRRSERPRLENLGEQVFTVQDRSAATQMAVMLKRNGTLFYFDLGRKDWLAHCDGTRLSQVLKNKRDPFGRPSGLRPLRDEKVELPQKFSEFPGAAQELYLRPRYGYTPEWRTYCEEQARDASIELIGLDETATPADLGLRNVKQQAPDPDREERECREQAAAAAV